MIYGRIYRVYLRIFQEYSSHNKCKKPIWIILRVKTHNTLRRTRDERSHFSTDEFVYLYVPASRDSSVR